jgi:hypothetical protein
MDKTSKDIFKLYENDFMAGVDQMEDDFEAKDRYNARLLYDFGAEVLLQDFRYIQQSAKGKDKENVKNIVAKLQYLVSLTDILAETNPIYNKIFDKIARELLHHANGYAEYLRLPPKEITRLVNKFKKPLVENDQNFMAGIDELDKIQQCALDAYHSWLNYVTHIPSDAPDCFAEYLQVDTSRAFAILRITAAQHNVDFKEVIKFIESNPNVLKESNFMDGVDALDKDLKYMAVLKAAYKDWSQHPSIGHSFNPAFLRFVDVAALFGGSYARKSLKQHCADADISWNEVLDWQSQSGWTINESTESDEAFMDGVDNVDRIMAATQEFIGRVKRNTHDDKILLRNWAHNISTFSAESLAKHAPDSILIACDKYKISPKDLYNSIKAAAVKFL